MRGTTPTMEFIVPFDTSSVAALSIVFAQDETVVLEKSLNDVTVDNGKFIVTLTQKETLRFKNKVEIQLRVRMHDGKAMSSNIITVNASRLLKDGVI